MLFGFATRFWVGKAEGRPSQLRVSRSVGILLFPLAAGTDLTFTYCHFLSPFYVSYYNAPLDINQGLFLSNFFQILFNGVPHLTNVEIGVTIDGDNPAVNLASFDINPCLDALDCPLLR